ncbi:MAG: cryptochrome/photolyase family protein, partial [Ponticaulis sp.]|nr:cryptochrome/photolyase family protein [Ponticaulis sp.]
VSKKTGDGSCPFNSLYWHFLHRNQKRLSDNGRLKRAYSTWERMSDEKRKDTLDTAEAYLNRLESL